MTKSSYWDNYHRRQYKEIYRSTLSIINFLKSKIPQGGYSVLDVGCGGGLIFIGLRNHSLIGNLWEWIQIMRQ